MLHSVAFKISGLFLSTFALSALGILLATDVRMRDIIDESQTDIYQQKLDVIHSSLDRNYTELAEAMMLEMYEEDSKVEMLATLQDQFYGEEASEAAGAVRPLILDRGGNLLLPAEGSGQEDVSSLLVGLNEGESGEFRTRLSGEDSWVIHQEFEPWGWKITYALEADVKYANASSLRIILGTIFLATFALFALICATVVPRFVTRPITKTVDALSEIANGHGDLTKRIPAESRDEMGQLATGFNSFVDELQTLVQQISSNTEVLAQGTQSVRSGSEQFSSMASEQANSLTEVVSSIQDISERTSTNAEHAKNAEALAYQAKCEADTGQEKMQTMVEAMDEIRESSHQIESIIRVIDEIAFQTNLLALNAAVEAARAGEAGQGFAVVAEEVRALALRSSEAARESSVIIEQSVQRADRGAKITQDIRAALDDIQEHTKDVNDLLGNIATASLEQSEGVATVNLTLSTLDDLTQSSAAGAERLASDANGIADTVQAVNQLVGSFRV